MKTPMLQLIDELQQITAENIQFAENLLNQPDEKLNFRFSEKSWSILECLEHLNCYGNFYIPEIRKRIENTDTKSTEIFSSGILGNYFASSMLPKEKLNRMKTFKSMNPIHSKLDKEVLNEFITQQKQMIHLLNEAENIDLNKVKTSINISNLIKLKLGDTFRFVIYHNLRHIKQAKRNL
ncbi:DinB family protein [Chryseobacterium sp. Ch-15]|uniref:DinB family protein n=1 Tax=Chryseobacterium muglaense TaxID=2893752 RepID=A0A9Q3UTM3_9FLAO|nr:DinB family protein [Chryseobacterium muglaense]MBD3906592.1 DinB family protein [Chryseobacterium muglaense]MCC9033536.1 DinB family protein [Chryseobacterium muglaense]MCM2556346.1 DinB family protein [Chryseobacterium muglaense]